MKFLLFILILIIPISAQDHMWEKLKGPLGAGVTFLVTNGDTLVIGSGHKGTIFYSLNGGQAWSQSDIKIADSFADCILTREGNLFAAGAELGIYRSSDLIQWAQVFYTGDEFWSVGIDPFGNLYGGTEWTDIYMSSDFGSTWLLEFEGSYGNGINNFHYSDSILWAGASNRVFFKSFKSSMPAWDSSITPMYQQAYKVISDGINNIYAHSYGGSRILKTTNEGETWIDLDTARFFQGNSITSLSINGRMIAGCADETAWFGDGWGIALSDDGGLTWHWQNNGLPKKIWVVGSLAKSGNITYAGTSSAGVFKSTDFGESWSPINNGLNAAHTMDIYFDDDGTIYSANWANGFQKSTDKGDSWQVINNGITNSYCYSIIADENGILLGGTDQGTFRSTDKGENWVQVHAPGNDYVFYFKKDKLNRIYALTYGTGLYRTTDLGNSWVKLDNGWVSGFAFGFAIDSMGNIYTGTRRGAIYKSTNDGQNWTEVYRSSNTGANVTGIVISSDGNIFATSSYEGILRSTDSGISWEFKNNGIDYFRSGGLVINSKGEIFASFSESNAYYARRKIFYSSDNGENWEDYTAGMDLIWINSMVLDKNDMVYLATDESVWKFNPDSTTDISDNKIIISEYSLHQNYPNPFNPATMIRYSVADRGLVSLKVFDILGREVKTLVNEVKDTGSYEIMFNPTDLASGIYIYQLRVNNYSSVRKMQYVK